MHKMETEDFIFYNFSYCFLVRQNIFCSEMCFDLLCMTEENGFLSLGSNQFPQKLWKVIPTQE